MTHLSQPSTSPSPHQDTAAPSSTSSHPPPIALQTLSSPPSSAALLLTSLPLSPPSHWCHTACPDTASPAPAHTYTLPLATTAHWISQSSSCQTVPNPRSPAGIPKMDPTRYIPS